MAQDAPRELTDSDYTAVSAALARSHGLSFSVQQVSAAIQATAEENSYHPIREYLDGLEWDGVPRLEHWLHDFLGAEQSDYVAGIGRLFMIAMVARVMKPGCKMDYTLILEGAQGLRKSTACRVLAGGRYFSDNLPPIKDANKDLSQHLSGKWLIEMAELSATSRADCEALKAFLTRTEEAYRPAYGRTEVRQPRQCVFIGTTNRTEYLRDSSGDRRFWPVKCGVSGEPCDIDGLRAARDQLFAEAYLAYLDGEAWWPSAEFEVEHIRPEQAKRYDDHPWLGTLETHFRTHPDMKEVTVSGLLNVPIGKTAAGHADKATVRECLQKLGWVHRRTGQQSDRWVLEN
ncbi:virulence-associated E family protein [Gluconobacter japonicus]|nr:virulence-associated E family protein [Gluconobacter japonicus]